MATIINDYETAMIEFNAAIQAAKTTAEAHDAWARLREAQDSDHGFSGFSHGFRRMHATPPRNFCMFYFARGQIWARADGQPNNRIIFPMSEHRDWFAEVSEAIHAAVRAQDRDAEWRWRDSAADLCRARREYLEANK